MDIRPDEVHTYELSAEPDCYKRIEVDQQFVDLVLEIVEENGSPVIEIDNLDHRASPEVVSFLGSEAEHYRLELRPAVGETGGRYRIQIVEDRQERPGDRLRIAAERTEAAADRQVSASTAESLRAALAGYRTALEGWKSLGERAKEAEMLYRIGVILRQQGQASPGLDSFDQALAIFKSLGDVRWQALALNQKGLTWLGLARFSEALAAFEQAAALRRAEGDPVGLASVLNNIGLVHQNLGDARRAQAAYQEALELFRQAGDRWRQGRALGNLAGTWRTLGEPAKALELFGQALDIARSVQDRSSEGEWLNFIGLVKAGLGEPVAALESYNAALALWRDLGDRRREAVVLGNEGALYLDLDELDRAQDAFERALRLYREVGARNGEALTLTDLGRAGSLEGRPAEALERFRQALAIEREIGDRANEAATLHHLGVHHLAQGEPREALAPLGESLKISRELGDRSQEARGLHNLGRAQARLGDAEAALASFRQALELRGAVGDPAGEVAARTEMARVEMGRGRLEEARNLLEPALLQVESLRLRIAADRLRSAYFASFRDPYELYVDLLMTLAARRPGEGLDARAFEAAELGRARGLVDLLREARVEIGRGADPKLLEEERRLRVELGAKAERQVRLAEKDPGSAAAAEARRDLAETLTAYELAESRLRAALPSYGALVRPEPLSLPAAQALLDPDTLLLEYSLGKTRSFLWAVSSSGLASFELPARAEIETAAREVHAALRTPDPQAGERQRQALDRLGRMLLGPVAGPAAGKRLAIVADGALQYVPFAALTLPSGEPVVERHEVVSLPSAGVLRELRRDRAARPPVKDSLAILADPVFGADDPRLARAAGPPPRPGALPAPALQGDLARAAEGLGEGGFPRLPWTRREAEAAAGEVGERPVWLALDFQASLDSVHSPELARYRVIHFATHGILDSRHPELSGLVLSLVDPAGRPRDGYLRLADLYNLELGADLVVLSGCETALGREIRGEGMMGLTRGFFHAGASQVMASLWAVRDRATAELMARFYRGLFRDGLPPAAALRAAQLAMRQDPRWRAPYSWAAFVLQGDWAVGDLGSAVLALIGRDEGRHPLVGTARAGSGDGVQARPGLHLAQSLFLQPAAG